MMARLFQRVASVLRKVNGSRQRSSLSQSAARLGDDNHEIPKQDNPLQWLCSFFQKDQNEIRDKRPFAMRTAATLIPKVKLLRSCGISAEEMWSSSSILLHSQTKLLKAVEGLKKEGVDDVSISLISNRIVRGYLTEDGDEHIQWLCSFFKKNQKEIVNMMYLTGRKAVTLVDKVDFLRSHGCTADDIWSANRNLFDFSLARLKKAMNELETTVGLGNFSTADVHACIRKQSISEKGADDIKWLCKFFGRDRDEVKGHRVLMKNSLATLQPKLELLEKHGISAQELWSGAFILEYSSNQLAEVLTELKTQDVGNVTARTIRNELYEHKDEEQVEWLCNFFQKDRKDLESKKDLFRQHISCLQPKIEYITSLGYTPADLWSGSCILRSSLAQLKLVVKELESYGMELKKKPLSQIFYYATHGVMSRRGGVILERVLLQFFQADQSSFPTVRPALAFLKFQQEPVLKKNLEFLQGHNFTLEHVRECLFIVGHNHAVLKHHYALLSSTPEVQPFSEWESDRVKLLNVLQYLIEKHYNFSWPIIFHDG